jgi:hypothetical protein
MNFDAQADHLPRKVIQPVSLFLRSKVGHSFVLETNHRGAWTQNSGEHGVLFSALCVFVPLWFSA